MTEQKLAAPVQLVDVQAVAKALFVSPGWVYKAAEGGQIPSLKVGKYLRFRLADVIAALENKEQ